ncbi:MAG: NAD(P)/FAD-dependent oxidoreductase [Nitrospirae bacterium]|nr:NAD(P)/FAD-dependent oxidoreductase [Nitrospirota bacterium]
MNYLIIGNSAAGISGAEAIRKVDKTGKITMVSAEGYPPYSRCLLSYYLAGDIEEKKLLFRPEDFYEKNKIEVLLGKKVEKIEPEKKKVILAGKEEIAYDKLLIATGASPKLLNIKGEDRKGVFGLRTVEDVQNILQRLDKVKVAAVLGGGLIGLKAAYGLRKRGLRVKVIIKSNRVLSQMLDERAAAIFRKRIEENGIEVMTGLAAEEILADDGSVKGLKLDNGASVDCQLVVIGKGVTPNIDLVKGTAIKVSRGISVDEKQGTNISDIYAAGDVAETVDIVSGRTTINALWPCAVEQGRIAGYNMALRKSGEKAGEEHKYAGSIGMNSIEFFDLPVISIGITRPGEKGYEEVIRDIPEKGFYRKIVLRDNRIVGAILLGRINPAGVLLSLIRDKVDVSEIKDEIMEETFNYSRVVHLMKEEKISETDRLFNQMVG